MNQLKKEVDLEKLPNPKRHLIASLIKSIVRILGYGAGMYTYYELAFTLLLLAEVIGIAEELV